MFNGDELQTGGGASTSAYIEIHGSEAANTLQVIDQLGDNDSDGLTDLVVSAVNDDVVTNQPDVITYMFQGADINAGGSFDVTSAGSTFGQIRIVDLLGYGGTSDDIDGDGDDDLLLGAPRTGYQIGLGLQNFDGIFACRISLWSRQFESTMSQSLSIHLKGSIRCLTHGQRRSMCR